MNSRPPRVLSGSLPRLFLLLLPILFCACGSDDSGGDPPSEDRPDVYFIVIDTLRADSLGCYGNPREVTPELDAFADECWVFEQASSASGWTLPSVASLLTGAWPTMHRALGKKTRLTPISEDMPTLAEMLRDDGYQTHGVANAAFVSPRLGLARGFDEFDHHHAYNQQIRRVDVSVDLFLEQVDATRRVPSFGLLHVFDPHLDYDPPEEVRGTFAPEHPTLSPPLTMKQCRELGDPRNPDAEENIAFLEGLYLEEVHFVDRQLGRLFDELRARGRYDDALIVVTSDHGEEFWEHGGFEHGHTLYDELVRVPLLVKPPGGAAGERTAEPVRVLDVVPTVLEFAGLESPASVVGASLLPLIDPNSREPRPQEPRLVLTEATLYGVDQYGLREGRWKYLFDLDPRSPRRRQLFNLESDPGELHDLVSTEPERADAMHGRLLELRRELTERAKSYAPAPVRNMSPREAENVQAMLESLGYLRGEDDNEDPDGDAEEDDENDPEPEAGATDRPP